MQDIQPVGDIYQIVVGDVKDGFSMRVGQIFYIGNRSISVTHIIKDENHFHARGKLRYLVWAKEIVQSRISGEEFVWQEFIDHPVKVTCKIP